jgi:2-dehydropantoate 2-reductase
MIYRFDPAVRADTVYRNDARLKDLIMRQVPHYLLIGNGRLARHLDRYLTLLDIPHDGWHRQRPLSALDVPLKNATHILLAIKDDAIEDFSRQYLRQTGAIKIQFSGARVTKEAIGAHPLMTFGHDLYSLEKYRAIPFVVDEGAPAFETLLPGLSNPHVFLAPALKPKYHALCVMAGNFSCLLWQKLFDTLAAEMNIPPETAKLYLRQQTENLLNNYKTALTGPLVRGDAKTLEKNVRALEGDAFENVYQSFIGAYKKEKTS